MAQGDSTDLDLALSSLLEEARPDVRAETLLSLCDRAGSRLWPLIENALQSPHRRERLAAVVAAERTRCFELEERIMRELGSNDAELAAAAAHAVATLSDLRTQEMLVRMLGMSKPEP